MHMTNSMNKARQRFEAWGIFQLEPVRIPTGEICGPAEMPSRKTETVNKTLMSQQLFASKGTELPGAAIDAHGVRITLRGAGLATGMTEGMPANALDLEAKKFVYNGSLRLQ